MKKLFVIALAAMGMVACVQNEVVEVVKSDAIAFDGAYVDNATRAEIDGAEDPSTTINTIQGFNVWGFMNGNGGTVFTGNDVTRSGDSWVYDDVQYWMPNNKYYFAGVSPIGGNWTATNGDTDNLYPVDVIDFINQNGTEDLLYAYATATTVDDVKNMDKVNMVFNHLLSKVKFTFQNGFGTEKVQVNVKDVVMTVPASGSYNVVEGKWYPTDATTNLVFGGTEKIAAKGDKHEATTELMTIPTTDYEYAVKFTVEVYQGEQLAYTEEKTSTISGLALEQGKAYNFTATITPENLDLSAIEFTATVTPWVKEGDFVFPVYRASSPEELTDALAAGTGTIILADNVNYGTIEVSELKDATIVGAEGAVMIFKTTSSSKLENVTLQNVNFEYTGATYDCGVVVAADAQIDNLVLDGCTFTGTGEKKGRGISGPNNNASIVIKNTTFKDLGYPIWGFGGYKALTVEGCTFENIQSWAIMPQSGFDGDLTVTNNKFIDLAGGIIKAGTLTAGHTFTFTNNTITNSVPHPNRNWFEFKVSAGTAVVSGNTMDGVDWTPGATEGLK